MQTSSSNIAKSCKTRALSLVWAGLKVVRSLTLIAHSQLKIELHVLNRPSNHCT